MARKRDTFALGLTAIVVFVLFFGAVIFIGQGNLFADDSISVLIRFPTNVALPQELKTGSAIYFGMQHVGSVEQVAFAEHSDEHFVDVKVRLPASIGIRDDARVFARSAILGGGGAMVIKNRGVNGRLVTDGDVIKGGEAGSLDAALDLLAEEIDPDNSSGMLTMLKSQIDPGNDASVIAKVHISLAHINEMTHALSGEFDAANDKVLLAKLHSILNNVNSVTDSLSKEFGTKADATTLAKIHQALDHLDVALADVAAIVKSSKPVVGRTLENVEHASAVLDEEIFAHLADQLNPNNSTSLISGINDAVEEVNLSLENTTVITAKVKELIILNADRVGAMVANLKETSDHTKAAGKDIRRNPWRLLYRPTLEESRQLNTFDAARELADAATKLNDVMTQLKSVVETNPGAIQSDSTVLAEIRDHLKKTFERFREAEDALWNQLNES
jgi:ABC-type transporter Mla subunit MlaD